VVISWRRILLEILIDTQLPKKFPALCKTALTGARHWILCLAKLIDCTTSHEISLRSALILSFHLRPRFPVILFSLHFTTKNLYYKFISLVFERCLQILVAWSELLQYNIGPKYVNCHKGDKITYRILGLNTRNIVQCIYHFAFHH
jgi:hypothetical protein